MTDSAHRDVEALREQIIDGFAGDPDDPTLYVQHGYEALTALLAHLEQVEQERDAEREKFHRHVEEMIEPKLLTRLQELEAELVEWRTSIATEVLVARADEAEAERDSWSYEYVQIAAELARLREGATKALRRASMGHGLAAAEILTSALAPPDTAPLELTAWWPHPQHKAAPPDTAEGR